MIEKTEQTVILPHLPESLNGLRMAHLTDIHRSHRTPDAWIREAVAVTNEAKPDFIVLTGDFVTDKAVDIAPCAELLAPLKAPLGVYAILGNHDYRAGAAQMARALESVGIRMLINRNVCLPGGLALVGIDDDREGCPDLGRAFADVPEDAPTIVLCHNPVVAERLTERECLAVAGHTHGGQVILPLVTTWKVRHIQAKHYRSGWFTLGKARLYVNRGIGNVGVSFRFLSRPEVALFTLQSP